MKIEKKSLILLLAAIGYFVLLLMWSIKEPLGSCCDENMRYQIPEFIFKNNRLPTLYDSSIWSEYYGSSYAAQPCLPYILGALFMKVAYMFGVSTSNLYMAARMTSILAGVSFAIFTYLIATKIFYKREQKIIFLSIVLLWPQLCYVFSYVNCDSVMLLGVSMIMYSWILGIKEEWSLKSCTILILGILFVALSYYNGYGFILMSIIAFIFSYIVKNTGKKKYKEMFIKGGIIAIVTILLVGWFFVRNYDLYGTFLGSNVAEKLSIANAHPDFTTEVRRTNAMNTMFSIHGFGGWVKLTLFSFIGMFGWMNIKYSTLFYYCSFVVIVILLVIAVIALFRKMKRFDKNSKIIGWCSVIASMITIFLALYFSTFEDYQPQGRYIMPIIIVFGYSITSAIILIAKRIENKNRILGVERKIAFIIPLGMMVLNLYTVFMLL